MIADVFERLHEPSYEAASLARQEARRFLDSAGVPEAVAADVELVISELASNAVDQAPGSLVWLMLAIADDVVYLSVGNRSTGEQLADPRGEAKHAVSDALLSEGGRGLTIVQALVDGMWINSDAKRTSVSCLRHFG